MSLEWRKVLFLFSTPVVQSLLVVGIRNSSTFFTPYLSLKLPREPITTGPLSLGSGGFLIPI